MRRILIWLLTAAVLTQGVPAARAVNTSASCAVVMDAESGRVLYEKAAHERRLIASITKLMTALVALESGHAPEEMVTVRSEWAGIEGSSIYLRAGENITLEALLYGLLLRSGNDAAMAVAGFCGGTVEEFVSGMNRKAEELGMTNSSFANPSGLDHEDHYSTAYDMALLARACLANETLAKIAATKSITLDTRMFTNHNKLLWRYEGCVGLKTGYTEKAGRTLVSAAQREGLTLICVTLNDPNDWADHTALLDMTFAAYKGRELAGEEPLCTLPVRGSLVPFCPVRAEKPVSAALAEGERPQLELHLDCSSLESPVAAGQRVGEAIWTLEGRELARVPLVTGRNVASNVAAPQTALERLKTRLAELSA